MSTERIHKPFRKLILAGLVILFLSITLDFLADILFWWQDADAIMYLAVPLLALAMFPGFTWMLISMLWHTLRRRFRDRPISGWVRGSGLTLCLAFNVLAAVLLGLTTFGSIRSITSQQTRLTGYLVPGGRAIIVTDLGVTSVNNDYEGDLTLSWMSPNGNAVASSTYKVAGGTSTEHDMAYGSTSMRKAIPLPEAFTTGMDLEWSMQGKVMVFANPQATSAHAGGPGGGSILVTVDSKPFSASGSLEIPSARYAAWWMRLLVFKEPHRLAFWLASLMLIFINCGFLTWAGLNDGFDHGKTTAGPQAGKAS